MRAWCLRAWRPLLLLAPLTALLPGCGEHAPDLIATLKGRCEGRWVVCAQDRARLPAGAVSRERLTIRIDSREPLGDALVPGATYARGTLGWGDRECRFELEYPRGTRDLCAAQVRYAGTVAPFGPGVDSNGFSLLMLTCGSPDEDRLCVDFTREAPVNGGIDQMICYERAVDPE